MSIARCQTSHEHVWIERHFGHANSVAQSGAPGSRTTWIDRNDRDALATRRHFTSQPGQQRALARPWWSSHANDMRLAGMRIKRGDSRSGGGRVVLDPGCQSRDSPLVASQRLRDKVIRRRHWCDRERAFERSRWQRPWRFPGQKSRRFPSRESRDDLLLGSCRPRRRAHRRVRDRAALP